MIKGRVEGGDQQRRRVDVRLDWSGDAGAVERKEVEEGLTRGGLPEGGRQWWLRQGGVKER